MLICHIAVCTHIPREDDSGPPPQSQPYTVLQPAPFNKSLGEKHHISWVPQTRNPPLEFQQGHVRTRAGEISIFLSLSEQFFTGNKTGLLQMTSPNDTQGYAVLLLSLLKDSSILISLFAVFSPPAICWTLRQPSHASSQSKAILNFSKCLRLIHTYSLPYSISNNWRLQMQSVQVIHHCE